MEPGRHYIELRKDFSNFDEVAERIRDDAFLEQLTARAHADLIASGRYSEEAWIRGFDDAVAARAEPRGRLASYPARRLSLEQLAAGRSYHVSSVYGLARELILGYLGTKAAIRRRALRRLVLRGRRHKTAAATSLWDDVFRLAMLTAIQTGALKPASEPFAVTPSFDAADGRLTLTSRHGSAEAAADGAAGEAVASALRAGTLREIVWNHAGVGQYVTMRVPPLPKRISFDVGRYDAYGVYRFELLADLARAEPELVLDALQPLLSDRAPGESDYRSRPQSSPTDANEAD